MTYTDFSADHAMLLDAVRDGGALALARFRREQKVWRKSKHHPVCEADLEVNTLLRERLCAERPDYGWLSEESEDDKERLLMPRVWVIDPIDGTSSYLNGIPEFAISAALVENGQPVSAVVYNPAMKELYEAVRGGGARLNGVNIEVSSNANPSQLAILTSRSERRESDWSGRFANGTVKAVSSIAYKFALVASGAFDAAASVWTKSDWDICAGDLLIREAGGRVTTLMGTSLVYNSDLPKHRTCLASNSLVHDGLLLRLADFAA